MVTDVNEQIGEKPDDERGCERRDLKEGAAGQFVETEIEGQAAYSDNEDRADDEEIFTVVEIHLFEHLQAADRNKPVQGDAGAAHDAFGDGIDNGHERGKEREQHAADRRIENGHDRGVFGDRHTADGFAVGGVRRAAEESAHDGADAVAEESLSKPGW